MAFALSSVGQGATAWISFSSLTINNGSDVGRTWVEWGIAHDGVGQPSDKDVYLLGHNSNDVALIFNTNTGLFRFWRSAGVEYVGSVPVVWPASTPAFIRMEYDDVATGTDALARVYFNGQLVLSFTFTGGTTPVAAGIGIRQYRYSPITLYRFVVGSDQNITGTTSGSPLANFSEGWDETTAQGTGSVWPSNASGTNKNLTLQNFTGLPDSWWVSYTGAAEPTSGYIFTTKDQGVGAYLALKPQWVRALSANWTVGITCAIHSLTVNAHLLGRVGSSAGSLRILTTGALQYRDDSVDRYTSVAGKIVVEEFYTYVLRRVGLTLEIWLGPESMGADLVGGEMLLSETFATFPSCTALNPLTQIGRYYNSIETPITVKKFWTVGGTYTDSWDFTTEVEDGLWYSETRARAIKITDNTTSANEWQVPVSMGVRVRALLLKLGLIQQIADAEVGTGKKPLVLVDGTIKERVASEGLPLIYDPTIAGLRTLASNETLQI